MKVLLSTEIFTKEMFAFQAEFPWVSTNICKCLLSLINQLKFYEFNVEVYGVSVKKGRGIDN